MHHWIVSGSMLGSTWLFFGNLLCFGEKQCWKRERVWEAWGKAGDVLENPQGRGHIRKSGNDGFTGAEQEPRRALSSAALGARLKPRGFQTFRGRLQHCQPIPAAAGGEFQAPPCREWDRDRDLPGQALLRAPSAFLGSSFLAFVSPPKIHPGAVVAAQPPLALEPFWHRELQGDEFPRFTIIIFMGSDF